MEMKKSVWNRKRYRLGLSNDEREERLPVLGRILFLAAWQKPRRHLESQRHDVHAGSSQGLRRLGGDGQRRMVVAGRKPFKTESNYRVFVSESKSKIEIESRVTKDSSNRTYGIFFLSFFHANGVTRRVRKETSCDKADRV